MWASRRILSHSGLSKLKPRFLSSRLQTTPGNSGSSSPLLPLLSPLNETQKSEKSRQNEENDLFSLGFGRNPLGLIHYSLLNPSLNVVLPESEEKKSPLMDPSLLVDLSVALPGLNPQISEAPSSNQDKEIRDPPGAVIEKLAHRMVVLRKRKHKIHRRKRRWIRKRTYYQSCMLDRQKKKEILYRTRLLEKIREAEKYDPKEFIKEYLENFNKELIPKTYQGKYLPQWLIKQLLQEDKMKAQRAVDLKKSVLLRKELVQPNETVEEFVERVKNKEIK